ncbi:tetratricopeptide repeat protein [Pectobacterium carotovorum]|uniref:tetratricopeptide repeat protein n=1 Tax=Pectobacterium carotovorum TaxID=554 RepID=UPI003016E921
MKIVSYSIIKSLLFSVAILFFMGVTSGTDFSPQKAIAAQNQEVPKPSEIKAAVNSGNWVLAHTLIKKVVVAHPDKPQSWYMKSQIEERLIPSGKATPQDALASLNKAMELDPTYSFGTSYENVTILHDRLTTKVNVSEGKFQVFTPDNDPILNKSKVITPSETEPLVPQEINRLSDNKKLESIISASEAIEETEGDSSNITEYLVFIFIALFLCCGVYFSFKEEKEGINRAKEKESNRIKSLSLATQLDDMLSKDISYIELDLPREFDSESIIIKYKERKQELVSIMEALLDKGRQSIADEINKLEELSACHVTERNIIKQAVEKTKIHMNGVEKKHGKELFEKIEKTCLKFLCDRLKKIDDAINESSENYSSTLRVSLKNVSHSFVEIQKDNNEIWMGATDVNVYYDNVVSEKIVDKLKAVIMGFYFFEGLFEKEKQIYRDKMEAQRRALIEEDLRINREMEASAALKREQEIREQERMMEAEYRRNNPPRTVYHRRSNNNGGGFLSGFIAGSVLNGGNNSSNKNSGGNNRSSSDSTFDFGKSESGKSNSGFDFGKSSKSSGGFDFGSNKNDDKW